MTIFMITHDLKESFELGTRLLVFDKIRHDPQAPEAYGATVTFDIPLKGETHARLVKRDIVEIAEERRAAARA
jgi:NitT/TauT family transport system ATP-binding protein